MTTSYPYDESPSEDYGPQPPHDNAAEQSVLGAMMLSPGAVNEVATVLTADDFYRPAHGKIYQAVLAVVANGEPVDAITVSAELEKRGDFGKIGKAPYLLDLIQSTPTASNAGYHAKIVAAKAKLRRMGQLGDRLKQLAYTDSSSVEDVDALLGQGEKFFRAQHEPDDKAMSFDGLVASWESWQQSAEGYIRTPWDSLNAKLNGGLQRGRVYTIGARPGVGKSVAALNIASFAARWDYRAVMFSLEMSDEEVTSRLIADGASVDLGRILRKELTLEDRAKIDTYIKENHGSPLDVIDRSRVTVEQIVAHCRSMPTLDVLVVDYLQLMTATNVKDSREQQVAHMSRSLKIAAKELNVAVVQCSQLNRGPLQNGKVRAPNIGDLRESGAVEQDSDVVLLLHNDEDDPGIIQLIVGKNRSGKMGDLVMNFEGRYARIT